MYDFICEKVAIIFAVAFTITSFSLLITGLVCFHTGAGISDKGVCTSVYISGLLLSALVGTALYMYMLKLFIDCVATAPTAPTASTASTAPVGAKATRQTVKKNPARILTSVIAV
jgi:hypothetical protein